MSGWRGRWLNARLKISELHAYFRDGGQNEEAHVGVIKYG